MNITTIRKNGITELTVIKECHAYRPNPTEFPDLAVLANQVKHPSQMSWMSVGNATDPNRIFPVGTPLQIIGSGAAQSRYNSAYIVVRAPNGITFDIMAQDISRFVK